MATSAALVERAVPPPPGAASALVAAGADAREEDVRDRAVHGVGHLLGEDGAGGADEHAGDDQRRVVERDARRGRGQPGEGVQGADHDRHVGAADRHDREHAQRARGQQDQPEQQLGFRPRRDHHGQRDRDQQQRAVDHRRRADRALHQLLQLQEGDVRAPEGDRADDRREQQRDELVQRQLHRRGAELDHRDDGHRAAADAVEQRHHLRHRGHLHAARGRHTDGDADRDAERRSGPSRRRPPGPASRRPRSPCRPPRSGCRAPRCAARAASAAR